MGQKTDVNYCPYAFVIEKSKRCFPPASRSQGRRVEEGAAKRFRFFRSHFRCVSAFCNEKGTLKTICPLITGDALLYSMFRETGNPMQCPFKPPYTFTYNRGHGDCKNPVSTVEACTQDSRLLFRYQACPDVEGSESARESMTDIVCVGSRVRNALRACPTAVVFLIVSREFRVKNRTRKTWPTRETF